MNDDAYLQAKMFAKEFFDSPVTQNDMRAIGPLTSQESESLVDDLERASKNPDALEFDVLVMVAKEYICERRPIPFQWLADFVADVLDGTRQRPTQRGPDPTKIGPDKNTNWTRKYKLWRTTQEVAKKFDLPLYTNNELSGKTTAADIVSEAMDISIEVVKRVCKNPPVRRAK